MLARLPRNRFASGRPFLLGQGRDKFDDARRKVVPQTLGRPVGVLDNIMQDRRGEGLVVVDAGPRQDQNDRQWMDQVGDVRPLAALPT